MANLITDNSTETFWQSDEEDRYETKNIDISLSKLNYICKTIYIHIDNSRDVSIKRIIVNNNTFFSFKINSFIFRRQ